MAPYVAHRLEQTQISKYHCKGGHGFAAEDANNFTDRIRGKQAKLVGANNGLNGANRVVDGLLVQSKYFRTAVETVAAAFDSATEIYRYNGQVLEVPKDQYELCLGLMGERIRRGQVPGFTDPADAKKIVREGAVTYKQARNVARAGNIDSLAFDAKTQAVTFSHAFAVSFTIGFAQNCWHGDSVSDGAREALASAVGTSSTTFITGVISAQAIRTKVAASGLKSIGTCMKPVSGTRIGREAIHRIAAGSLGKAVYGSAAVNHVSKLLRSNSVTATAQAVATCTPDFYRAMFDRSMSWRQFTKNLVVNAAGIAGGSGGWFGGAAVGAAAGSVVPLVGTAAGGVVGGIAGAFLGGTGCSSLAKTAADKIAEDDSTHLLSVLSDEIAILASDYMLTEEETIRVADHVKKTVGAKWLRRMFKVGRRSGNDQVMRRFVRREFEPYFRALVEKRPKIEFPTPDFVAVEFHSFFDLRQMLRLFCRGIKLLIRSFSLDQSAMPQVPCRDPISTLDTFANCYGKDGLL